MREIAHRNVYLASFFSFSFFLFLRGGGFFQRSRLRNDLYCVEWDVKRYYTIPSSNARQLRPPEPIFTRNYVKRRGSAQACAFSGLENKNIPFTCRNSRKNAILRPVMTRKVFGLKPLYNESATM